MYEHYHYFSFSLMQVTMHRRSNYDVTGPSSKFGHTVTEDHQAFFTNLSPILDGQMTITVENVLAVAARSIKLNGELLCRGKTHCKLIK